MQVEGCQNPVTVGKQSIHDYEGNPLWWVGFWFGGFFLLFVFGWVGWVVLITFQVHSLARVPAGVLEEYCKSTGTSIELY